MIGGSLRELTYRLINQSINQSIREDKKAFPSCSLAVSLIGEKKILKVTLPKNISAGDYDYLSQLRCKSWHR